MSCSCHIRRVSENAWSCYEMHVLGRFYEGSRKVFGRFLLCDALVRIGVPQHRWWTLTSLLTHLNPWPGRVSGASTGWRRGRLIRLREGSGAAVCWRRGRLIAISWRWGRLPPRLGDARLSRRWGRLPPRLGNALLSPSSCWRSINTDWGGVQIQVRCYEVSSYELSP